MPQSLAYPSCSGIVVVSLLQCQHLRLPLYFKGEGSGRSDTEWLWSSESLPVTLWAPQSRSETNDESMPLNSSLVGRETMTSRSIGPGTTLRMCCMDGCSIAMRATRAQVDLLSTAALATNNPLDVLESTSVTETGVPVLGGGESYGRHAAVLRDYRCRSQCLCVLCGGRMEMRGSP